jgi:hypothetical protein
MTYQITASPIQGQTTIKTVTSVWELHQSLSIYKELGYDIKRINRVLQLAA